ncbi:MAG TPA: hypothetical protein EYP14_19830 [Planctomycetaceae bacterium]|nr:hypothetical protein [Planctomycetaceae bacterium]
MSSVRLRRLRSDYEKLRHYVKRHPRLQLIQADGDPPERYQLEYRIRSLRQVEDELTIVTSHLVEILLPRHYPRTPPQCRMLTPVFHPNIAPHAICVGDHWSAGEPLWSIVARIGEMLAFQSYNVKSPLNGEAARWVDDHPEQLPLDSVSMLIEETDQTDGIARPPAPAASPTTTLQLVDDRQVVPCPGCGARLRLNRKQPGQRVRCPRCQKVMVLHAESRP